MFTAAYLVLGGNWSQSILQPVEHKATLEVTVNVHTATSEDLKSIVPSEKMRHSTRSLL